ncbi:hypothetical protein VTN49DRAFT_6862 [Thermomyces lanuginosus]|uniref:uncharacterized protein n=1 Tax=Thermomyces lanuginosus TaxID=5541 RepID=UPI003742976E
MRSFISGLLLSVSSLAAFAQAQAEGMVKVHVVKVGWNGELLFSPENVKADVGDIVQFQFYPKNHSVVQSTFDNPCLPISETKPDAAGFHSGYMPVAEDAAELPVFSIRVNDTKPIWAYCSQGQHCENGMVFAINAAETGEKSFTNFKSLAMGASSSDSAASSSETSSSSTSSAESAPTDTSSSSSDGSADAAATTLDTASAETSAPPPETLSLDAGFRHLPSTSLLGLVSLVAIAFAF